MDAKRVGLDAKRVGLDAKRVGLDARRVGMDARRVGLDARRVGIGRCLAHLVVMTTVMGGLLAGSMLPAWAAVRSVRLPAGTRPVDVAPPPEAPASADASSGDVPVEPSAPAAVNDALGAASPPMFEPGVERWRDLGSAATSSVRRATGVSLDDNLLLALVAVESGGRPEARSSTGAVGLTQVEPATYADLQARYGSLLANRPLAQPSTNLLAGALYLVECARFLQVQLSASDPDSLELVLDAYNLGPRATAEWWHEGAPQPQLSDETIQHATRILAAYSPQS